MCYSEHHQKADEDIADSINDLCRELRLADGEEADEIVARIARLRRSMSPVIQQS